LAADVRSEVPGSVWKIVVDDGAAVAEGEEIVILESMKMEIPVVAPAGGTVRLKVEVDAVVDEGDLIAVIE
jgi:biotin carboxyl carrier protein